MLDEETTVEKKPMTTHQAIIPGTLYVIAAPSGAGKTSLTTALIKTLPNIGISVSHTTRSPRPGEEHAKDYFFVPTAEFEAMIASGDFLEYAQVFGNYYGTTHRWVENRLQQGWDVILEIDWQGARQVRQLFPQSVQIFILPPSANLLKQRLCNRKQDELNVIEQRLAAASEEVAHYRDFDYIVVNDVFDSALQDLQAIITATRLKTAMQTQKHAKLLAELIKSTYNKS